jgi:hypothetical protein
MLSACASSGSKQSTPEKYAEPPYSIGDLVNIGGADGIVFSVTAGGYHGKAMSVSQRRGEWYEANAWCKQYGKGWGLPSSDELMMIYKEVNTLNSSLQAKGYTLLSDTYYWSSEKTSRVVNGYVSYKYRNAVLIFVGYSRNKETDENCNMRAVISF